jgi:hypothetical protein
LQVIELYPDLDAQQQQRMREIQQQKKAEFKRQAKEKLLQKQAAMAAKEARSYDRIMVPEKMTKVSEMNATVDLQWSQVKRYSLCNNSFQMRSMKIVSYRIYIQSVVRLLVDRIFHITD